MDRITAANEVAFRLGFSGHSGHLKLEPLPPVERSNSLKSLPDFILPPASLQETPESVKKNLEEKYLQPQLDSDEFSVENSGRQWDFDWFDRAKVSLEPSAPRSVVIPAWELPFRRSKNKTPSGVWDPASIEVDVAEILEGSQDSGTTPRMPGPAKDFVRGSINNRPFRPGGLIDSPSERFLPESAQNGDWVHEIIDGGVAQSVPPSFKKGLDLGCLKQRPCHWKVVDSKITSTTSVSEENMNRFSVQFDDLFKKAWEEDIVIEGRTNEDPGSTDEEAKEKYDNVVDIPISESLDLDEILLEETREVTAELHRESNSRQQKGEAWALPGGNGEIANRFYELVPDMALDFPFELDKFQKEADISKRFSKKNSHQYCTSAS